MEHSRSPGRLPAVASGGMENYRSEDTDNERGYEESCRRSAAAVQAILDGLLRPLRLAVYVKHGISDEKALMAAALYVNRGDPGENYREACGILAVQLSARGMC